MTNQTPLQALWLVIKRDPNAIQAKETLDRELSSLEPFLEALPSLGVMLYINLEEPYLYSSTSSKINLTRAYWVTCFTMTLFLKRAALVSSCKGRLFFGDCHLEVRRRLRRQHAQHPQQDVLAKGGALPGCEHTLCLHLQRHNRPPLSLPSPG